MLPSDVSALVCQVLDKILLTTGKGGQWLTRANFGWLPTSYMRTMPAYYRGIVPVIDHDHGNPPGMEKHSEAKPTMPKVRDMKLCDPDHPANQGRPLHVSEAEAQEEAAADALRDQDCALHGQNCDHWTKRAPQPGDTLSTMARSHQDVPGTPGKAAEAAEYITALNRR